MGKRDDVFREQLAEAIDKVRTEAGHGHDFARGMQSGASMVGVYLSEIQRRDAAMKAEGLKRGSP